MFKVGDSVRRMRYGPNGLVNIGDVVVVDSIQYSIAGSPGFFVKGSQIWHDETCYDLVDSAKTPHKHAALIKAWADGAEIEVYNDKLSLWQNVGNPTWSTCATYRIKPEPKPDVVEYRYLGRGLVNGGHTWLSPEDNIKAIFDGETGKLKSVELIS